MTITIIGGSCFLWTRLAKRLLDTGHDVRIADKRRSAAYPDLWTRCDIRNAPDGTDEYPESITDAAGAPGKDAEARNAMPMYSLLKALRGSDAVVNLAAEHRDDVTPKSLYDEVNVLGSRNVCAACTALKIRRIIFTSSVVVYGFAPPTGGGYGRDGREIPDGGARHEPQEHELRGERGGVHRVVRRARDGAGRAAVQLLRWTGA